MTFYATCFILGVLVGFVFILIIKWISVSNQFERLKVKIAEAESGVDVALTNRYDTLVKLRDLAQNYTTFEQDTLAQIVHLRADMTLAEKEQADAQMQQSYQQLLAVGEAYPQLGSQNLFIQLQNACTASEDNLQATRRLYNANVSLYNQLVQTFPSKLVAAAKGISVQPMFKADTAKREDVSMKFGTSVR